jgi:hypothetical protein
MATGTNGNGIEDACSRLSHGEIPPRPKEKSVNMEVALVHKLWMNKA